MNDDNQTNTACMTIEEPKEGTKDLALLFGGDVGEFLKFNRAADCFEFSNDLSVTEDTITSGTTVRIHVAAQHHILQ